MVESMKDKTTKVAKLDKFDDLDFRRRQKKMHFMLTTLKVVYVLSSPDAWDHGELNSKFCHEDESGRTMTTSVGVTS